MGQQPSGTKARDRATPPVRETAGPVRETPSAGGGTQAADRDSSGAEHHRLVGEIGRVLKSGISYDLREMKRNIAGAFPDAQVETIAKALEGLRIAGSVERIAMPSGGFRYRRRVQARDRHDQEAQRAEA